MPPPQSLTWTSAARSPWRSHPLSTRHSLLSTITSSPLVARRSTTPSRNQTWTCQRWAVAPCRAGDRRAYFQKADRAVQCTPELAKCTSDTVFLEKTSKMSDLISSITQDYHLDEQDAEGPLVQGIIRISTCKSRSRPQTSKGRSARSTAPATAPNSGHETMVGSGLSQDELTVQISQETPADAIARKLRPCGAPGVVLT